jgi:hypothetical protein
MIEFVGQAVWRAAPNVIYVRDAAGGMPEWVKITISAFVGALLAIGSNVAMEFIKPIDLLPENSTS